MSKFNSWHTSFDKEGESTGGGNANVFFVKDKSTDEKYALKELRFTIKKGEKNYKRKTCAVTKSQKQLI